MMTCLLKEEEEEENHYLQCLGGLLFLPETFGNLATDSGSWFVSGLLRGTEKKNSGAALDLDRFFSVLSARRKITD